MLTVIAHQEDVKRYKGAVTYYNEQLMPLCGFGGRKRLVLARNKAVVAGWLEYQQGKKGKPGLYWTVIPPQYQDLPDTPMDESSDDFCRVEIERQKSTCRSETEQQTDIHPPVDVAETERQGDGKGTESGTANGHLPNHTHSHTHSLKYIPAHFGDWWSLYPRKESKAEAEKAFPKAIKAIAATQNLSQDEAVEWLLERTRTFAASEKGQGAYCPHGSTWLNQRRFDDDPAVWKERTKNGQHRTGAGQVFTGEQTKPIGQL